MTFSIPEQKTIATELARLTHADLHRRPTRAKRAHLAVLQRRRKVLAVLDPVAESVPWMLRRDADGCRGK